MNQNPVIVIKASQRINSNSDRLAESVVEGLKSTGQACDVIAVGKLNIQPCSGCNECQEIAGLICNINDDMKNLYPRLQQASGLVIASPVYYYAVNGQAKNFIDRAFYPFNRLNGNLWLGKPLAAVLSYADDDPFLSGAVNALRMYQDIARHVKMTWAGAVYSSSWDPDEMEKQHAVLKTAFELGVKLAEMV